MVFDLVLVFGTLMATYLGGRRGLLKQLISLAAVYISMLLALSLQGPLTGAFARSVGVLSLETEIFFYALLFLVSYIGIEILSFVSHGETRLRVIGALDPVLGGVLGAVWWLVGMGAILTMVFYSLTVPWSWRLAPIAAALRADFQASLTLPTLAALFKAYAIAPLRLLISPLPPILTGWP